MVARISEILRTPRRLAPRLVRGLAKALLLAALAGCAAPVPLLQRARPSGPQWPEPPMPTQIEWVKSVSSPEDAGIVKSFWRKAIEVFTGPGVSPIVRPYGVLYDDAGRLFIADTGAGIVHLMDTRENVYTRITGPKGALFVSPIGLAEDGGNRLYITDSAAGTVYRYDLATRVLTPFLRGAERPTGVAYNRANGLLYISDTTAHRVIAVDGTGRIRHSFGERAAVGSLPLNLPTDLATDAKGQLFVNDPLNYKIKTFTPEGELVSEFGSMGDVRGELNKPKGIAVDSDEHIYVADSLLDTVQIFDDNGQFLFSFGATGTEDGAFWMPSGLCIHGNYIFVADTFNKRIQIFRRVTADGEAAKAAPAEARLSR